MGLFGGIMGGIGAEIAGSPKVPKWNPITAQGTQTKAIAGNLQSLPELEKLAGQTNTFNQQELERMLTQAIPGYKAIQDKSSEIVQGQLAGELSESELRAYRRNAAAYGAASGTGDSDFGAKRTLRDLGLGTLERQQTGLNNAQAWMRNSASLSLPQMFDMNSMFLTPESTFNMEFQNQSAQFSRDWMKNQLKWGSRFSTSFGKGLGDMGGGIDSMIGSYGGSAATAAGTKAGGGGGY